MKRPCVIKYQHGGLHLSECLSVSPCSKPPTLELIKPVISHFIFRAKARQQQRAKQRNVKEADSKSRSRSNSNSRSRSPPKKEREKEEAMDDDGELKTERSDRNSSQRQNNPRPSRQEESGSSDDNEDRQRSNKSKPYNFEDELAAAKKRVLEKSKSEMNVEDEVMDHGNDDGRVQDKGNFSEMTDLDTAEANVVDIDLGIDSVE